jgi:hypothetical protein
VSRGQAPIYSEYSRENIPINRRTLERVTRYVYFFDKATGDLDDRIGALHDNRDSDIERYPAMRDMFETLDRLEHATAHVYDEAMRRDRILFQYNTTSATEQQTRSWIADITRNPENSLRSHVRRFSEWVHLIEAEYTSAISTNGASLPGGSLPPARRAINRIFEQEEIRDQMRMQGDQWTGPADAWITSSEDDERVIRRTRRRDRRSMSDQPSPSKQGANVPEKKADKKPEDTPTPEQQTQHPVAALTLLLVNPNKHHENEMSKIHVTMLDLWEQEKAAEAEQLALLLLSYSTLPIPYRAFAHMVSPLLST